MKKCSICRKEKPLSEYHNYLRYGHKLTYRGECKVCNGVRRRELYDPEKQRVKTQKSYYKNHEKRKEQARKKARRLNHGDEYQRMLLEQNGLCAACGNPETSVRNGRIKDLALDHDHKTGKLRGLLCQRCNTALGQMKDNKENLQKLILYLESKS